MDYLLEISRIIDGASKGDQMKVEADANQLATKLNREGDTKAAQKQRRMAEQLADLSERSFTLSDKKSLMAQRHERAAIEKEKLVRQLGERLKGG